MLKLSGSFKFYVVRNFLTWRGNSHPTSRQIHNFTHTKLLGKYLFLTNTITSGLFMAVGDGIQQQLEFYNNLHEGENYNWRRTIDMTLIGLALGPPQHVFFKYVDIYLPKQTFKSVVKKIFLDQLIASPISILIFFYGLGLLENRNLKEANEEVKEKFFTVYMMDWMVWPLTQYINFTYLSPKYRVLYVNLITVVYDIFLSYIKYEVPGGVIVPRSKVLESSSPPV